MTSPQPLLTWKLDAKKQRDNIASYVPTGIMYLSVEKLNPFWRMTMLEIAGGIILAVLALIFWPAAIGALAGMLLCYFMVVTSLQAAIIILISAGWGHVVLTTCLRTMEDNG